MKPKVIQKLALQAALVITLILSATLCESAWSFGKITESIGSTVRRPLKRMVGGGYKQAINVVRGRDSHQKDQSQKDNTEQFEAMCLLSREPSLSRPPEVNFFSTKSHSARTLGCTEGVNIELNYGEEEEEEVNNDMDESLKRNLIDSKLYNGSLSTYFLVHGFMASWDSDSWMCQLKDMILNGSAEANVFIVDWSGGSKPLLPIDYGAAVTNTKYVAELLAKFIENLLRLSSIQDAENVHLIGHSLGAQISGFVGYHLDGTVGRITALDPAGPCFSQWNPIHRDDNNEAAAEGFLDTTTERRRLSASSAKLVIALHTDCSLFGLKENCAHYDIYVNGGVEQPGCDLVKVGNFLQGQITDTLSLDITCAHSYGHELIESFDEDESSSSSSAICQPMAYECSSWEAFIAGECGLCGSNDAKCIFIGLHKDLNYQTPPTSLIYSNSSNNKPFMNGEVESSYTDDCEFNDEVKSSYNSKLFGGVLTSSLRSATFSTPKSSSSSYLISKAKHFIRSDKEKPHCLYQYQVLIGVAKNKPIQDHPKFYLSIPLNQETLDNSSQPSENESEPNQRLIQVSHLIGNKSRSYSVIKNSMLKMESTDDTTDYYSALITFRSNCDTQHDDDGEEEEDKSLCNPLQPPVRDGDAKLWATHREPLKSVRWVSINFMSHSKLDQRVRNSFKLHKSSMVQHSSNPPNGWPSKNAIQKLASQVGIADLASSISVGSSEESSLQYYVKLKYDKRP